MWRSTSLLDGGVLVGNQTNRSNYGLDSFIRPQRPVVSYVYDLPSPANHFFHRAGGFCPDGPWLA